MQSSWLLLLVLMRLRGEGGQVKVRRRHLSRCLALLLWLNYTTMTQECKAYNNIYEKYCSHIKTRILRSGFLCL